MFGSRKSVRLFHEAGGQGQMNPLLREQMQAPLYFFITAHCEPPGQRAPLAFAIRGFGRCCLGLEKLAAAPQARAGAGKWSGRAADAPEFGTLAGVRPVQRPLRGFGFNASRGLGRCCWVSKKCGCAPTNAGQMEREGGGVWGGNSTFRRCGT